MYEGIKVSPDKKGFNSTLVQLKGIGLWKGLPVKVSFNSTLVQLKVVQPDSSCLLSNCFNSTLVQLKEVNRAVLTSHPPQFQFYLSSIKRRRKMKIVK